MKILKRSVAAALLASVALSAGPVLAKDPPAPAAPKPPKLSKPYAKTLMEAQKLMQAGDNAGGLAKLNELDAVPPTADDDAYTTLSLKLNAAIGLKDNALTEQTLSKMLATGKVPAADQGKFYRTVGSLALNRKDYNAATMAFQELVKMNPGDGEAQVALSELYAAQKQNSKAVDTLNAAIAAQKAAGQAVPEAWYRRALAFAYDGKLPAQVQPTALALVTAYPNAVNWRDALVITRDSFQLDDQGSLDFMRLQAATNSLNGERDFVEYADTALGRGFPGEAQYAINEGIKKNMLNASKPLVAELKRSADSKVAADKAALPGLEKEIKTNGKLALATGDAYYGYGDFAKAATLYRQAVGNAAVDQATANLRLGMALARSGDKAGATTALQAVKGGPREVLAQYWMAYIGAGAPAAA
ncbi:tetratricopeptide repeat protein [Sandarakinorhabdus sp. DWP1-3-1]|uniref:tetratricopeptide repeat protein n=1 Tax=Sandarakinorhabdus sp. DWP1-3-1 TaxID=2804627 RepID=UPI003CF7A3FD